MSRKIDTSDVDSLSDEDVIYLHQRGKVSDAVLIGRDIDPATYNIEPLKLEDKANTGTANTEGLTPDEFQAKVNSLASGNDEDDDDDEEDELADYSEWTKDQLIRELSHRNLAVAGRKEELIERLEADDVAADESSDDDNSSDEGEPSEEA